jgi:hypothetical protein
MSNELSISAFLNYQNGLATLTASASAVISVASNQIIHEVANIPTTDTALNLGAVGTIGYVLFQNIDGSNFISIGSDGTNYPIKLLAGESALMRWNAAAIHCKADTAACNLQYRIVAA